MRQFGKGWALAALILLAGCGADREEEAQTLVNNFYQTHQTNRPGGALSLNQLIIFRPYLSVSLFDMLKDVSVAEEAHLAQTDADTPALVDGDLFTTHPQGASSFRLLTCQVEDDTSNCSVEVQLRDEKQPTPFKSIDRVVLTRDARGWVIDNIVYTGAANSGMHQGDLQKTLRAILANNSNTNASVSVNNDSGSNSTDNKATQ